MIVEKYGNTRNWALWDDNDELICLTVYKKGAIEVKRRLEEKEPIPPASQADVPTQTLPDTVR